MRWVIITLIIALAGAAGIAWRQATATQETNRRLAAENEALKQQFAAVSEEQNQKREAESKKTAADAQELARLRGEVSRLRVTANEVEKLRGEIGALKAQNRAQPAADAIPTPAAADQFPRQSWAFSGYATPEAALVSAIWAMKEGKPQVFLDGLSPEEQQRFAQQWQGKSEEEIAAKHQKDVLTINEMRILSRTPVSPTEVQVKVFLEGADRVEAIKMKQGSDQQWKFGGFVRESPK